jgi:hypothetical protein
LPLLEITNDTDKTWEHFKQGVIKAAILTLGFETNLGEMNGTMRIAKKPYW